MLTLKHFALLLSLPALMWSALASSSQDFDQTPAWPLCGRILEAPPTGWNETDGCPSDRWGNPDYTDLPLSSTFGPRQKFSEGSRYDYHRGIDIPTPVGTPVFAMADGIVKIAGNQSAYSDPLIQIRHYRPGYSSCRNVGCYHSNYMHMDSWTVSVGQSVSKGDLIGYTGVSASGFPHLHFEIRSASLYDVYSAWQRDAIHPLHVLPYNDSSVPSINFDSVDVSRPDFPVVQVTVTTPRVDVTAVWLVIYDEFGNEVTQPGDIANDKGYNVNPAMFDMDGWNSQYSHKNNSKYPWSSFGEGGDNECPHHDDHDSSYDANVHLDAHAHDDLSVGLFNGVKIAPASYRSNTLDYSLTLTFNELNGPAQCIKAYVFLAADSGAVQQWGDCSGL